jgi:hypothetical protein
MGLDQSFYKDKERQNELLYFRKFRGLHHEIESILGEQLENGKTYRLNKADLEKVVAYIIAYSSDYWAWETENDEVPETLYKALGVLTYYAVLDKPLYYNGDW